MLATRPRPASLLAAAAALAAGCSSGSTQPVQATVPGTCNCAPTETCQDGQCVPVGGGGGGGACFLPPPAASAAVSPIVVIDLGTRQVGATVTFPVPQGAASVTVVEQALSAPETIDLTSGTRLPNAAVPLLIEDGAGNTLYDDRVTPPDPAQASLYFASPSAGVGAIGLPDSSAGLALVAAGLPGGNWSAVVSDFAYECSLLPLCTPASANTGSTYDVKVLVKPGFGTPGAIPASGTVDVTFHLTPGQIAPPLSAATARTDPDLQRMLASLRLILSRAGLTLGAVSYRDLPKALADQVATGVDLDDASACGDLSQLFASGPPGRQVNVFLVSGFTARDVPPGTIVAGVDGTIPGPSTFSPTLASGFAVAVADLRVGRGSAACSAPFNLACGADATAYITAHEMGHFLGLYHATEAFGTLFDPLNDTPSCTCRSCASNPAQCSAATNPHVMGVGECSASPSCGGGDDLMFWLVGPGSVGNLTAEQGRVARSSPAVY